MRGDEVFDLSTDLPTDLPTGGPADGAVDVAVVGCGPVGAALATLLGLQGHRVLVLERHPASYPLPRAVHFDHEVARVLQACGLGPDLPAISEPGSEYEWRNGAGQVLLRFGGRPVGPSGWPDFNMFWQPGLERLLEAAAAAQPTVEVRRGARLAGLDVDPDGGAASLEVERTGGPAPARERVRARYVVGCDGANSAVRSLVGGTVTDLGFFYDWLIVDVALHEPRVYDPINLQVCEPARPTTAVSGGPGRRRWEFMRLPGETIEELDDEARAWELLAPWDVTPGNATLERHAVYRFQARWADRWRFGTVLLAGDAAHLMPPFAGQGLCSGLRDAANLSWKLGLVLEGHAGPALLDAYEAERRDNVRAVIELSMALGKVICVTDPAEAAARDAAMAEGAAAGAQAPPPLPGVTVGVVRAGDPLAGRLFIQGRVAPDGPLGDAGPTPSPVDGSAAPGGKSVHTAPGGGDGAEGEPSPVDGSAAPGGNNVHTAPGGGDGPEGGPSPVDGSAVPGGRSVHTAPASGGLGEAVLFDDVVGAGWRLVTADPAAVADLPPDLAAWFAGIGGRVVTVTPGDDVDGTYARWFADHRVTAALQRPDFHLYGAAGPGPGDPEALLGDLRRALARPPVPVSPGGTP